ncbi:MAG: hypothetical protein Q8L85_02475 [Alphaproteobacteria bacterium]|nr:hypothetical protein [Alphaproteobacteria bacterium]MDP3533055.1 hypothetical protein [Alphaproteobacteria bacterium]
MYKLSYVALALFISSCSVYKAASNDGVAVSDVRKCHSRGCYLSLGMEILDKHTEENGKYTETYRAKARKSGFNYVRAAGHGALDVMTLGLWEVAGTPVEGALSNNRGYITARVVYASKNSDVIEKIEVHDADGLKVQ